MPATVVEVDGISYNTLYELPPNAGPSTPCVLLVHALMSNVHMWDWTTPTLHEAGFASLRFDHIGHNQTPGPPAGGRTSFHMDDLAHHMHRLVEAVTGHTHVAAVIGCSIGGVLALRYAMLFPGDVDRIISIAAPGIAAPAAAKPLWTKRVEQFERDERTGGDSLCYATVERWFPADGPGDDQARSRAFEHVRTCSLPGYRLLADTIRDYDYGDEVGGIREGIQCLIVAGGQDSAASPSHLRDVSTRIAGAEFVLMEDSGHLPPMHRPEEFGRLMLRFLRQ